MFKTILQLLAPTVYALGEGGNVDGVGVGGGRSNEITNPVAPFFGSGNVALSFSLLIVTLWQTAITLGGISLLIMLLLGALEWVTAGGEKGKVEHARDRMTQAVIGMLVLIGVAGISVFISGVFKIDLLKPTFENRLP